MSTSMLLQSLALLEAARGESRAQGQVQKCGRSLYIIDHFQKSVRLETKLCWEPQADRHNQELDPFGGQETATG